MERLKLFLGRIFPRECKMGSKEYKCNHVVTIDEIDGRTEVSTAPPRTLKVQKKGRFKHLIDILFFIVASLLWIISLSFFIKSEDISSKEKFRIQEYVFGTCVIILIVVSITGLHSESFFLQRLEKLVPKVTVVVRKGPAQKTFVLRIRTIDDEEFIETEISDTKLTVNDVVELCAKELNIQKEKVACLYKYPDTRIRSDDDVKRFRRLEYVEVKLVA